MVPQITPNRNLNAFHCPRCGHFQNQLWETLYHRPKSAHDSPLTPASPMLDSGFRFSQCQGCFGRALWSSAELIYPPSKAGQPAHFDMPEDCRVDFEEARAVVGQSPRSAAALLRLVVQKLLVHLGESGKNINQDIANLVRKGMPGKIQQALDICRVVGNESVHPGTLSVKEDPAIVLSLFDLINFVVQEQITRTKEIDALYVNLPASAVEAIAKRDSR